MLSARAERFLQIPRSHIIPMGPFAAPSAECMKLFRDGYFFGCITLAQAVTDAIIRHVDWIEFPNDDRTKFVGLPKRLQKLHKGNRIGDAVKLDVERIWFHRNHFHHLDPRTQLAETKLEEIAKETLAVLARIEADLFGFSVDPSGAISPHKPQYWNIQNGQILAFIRRS